LILVSSGFGVNSARADEEERVDWTWNELQKFRLIDAVDVIEA